MRALRLPEHRQLHRPHQCQVHKGPRPLLDFHSVCVAELRSQYPNTGDLRRNHIHYYRGWIGSHATGNVNTHAVNRGYFLAETNAIWTIKLPRLPALSFMEAAHSGNRFTEAFKH